MYLNIYLSFGFQILVFFFHMHLEEYVPCQELQVRPSHTMFLTTVNLMFLSEKKSVLQL